MNRIALAAAACAVFALACNRGEEPSEPAPQPAADAAAPEPSAPTVPCILTTGEIGIQNLQLEAADGGCRLYLPTDVAPGEYAVRVSAVGEDDAAAVEATTPNGPLYATRGTVVVTSADGERVVGRIEAEDAVDPVVGSIVADFDVAIAGP